MIREKELNAAGHERMAYCVQWGFHCGGEPQSPTRCEKDGKDHKSLPLKAMPMLTGRSLLTGVEALLYLLTDRADIIMEVRHCPHTGSVCNSNCQANNYDAGRRKNQSVTGCHIEREAIMYSPKGSHLETIGCLGFASKEYRAGRGSGLGYQDWQ